MTVELIYINDCPNVAMARTHLMRAFARAELPPRWTEWESGSAGTPAHARGYASPTILVDGKDVAGAEPSDDASCCRLYADSAGGSVGAPEVEAIAVALLNAQKSRRGPWGWLAIMPGIGVALLPKIAKRKHKTTMNRGDVTMNAKRKIEIFSAGCPACEETIEIVNRVACPSCEVSILDMNDGAVARRAKELGIRSVPAVVIDGKLADCCAGRGPDEAALRAAGLGQPS